MLRPSIKQGNGKMKNISCALALGAALLAGPALAADLPTKAAPFTGFSAYPTKCGLYYGVGTMGSSGSVASPVIGTQVVQGAIGLNVGYTCPVGASGGYWFADGLAAFANLNGTTNGFNPTGPAQFMERFGFGAPVNMIMSLIPGLSSLQNAVPALIPLPAGTSIVTTSPYIAGAFHQDDTGVSVGLASNKTYLFSGGFQVGTKTRISNGLVLDNFAEYTLPSTEVCLGVLPGCVKRGAEVRVGALLQW
jgi:opacity protein-like surface antigen